MKNYRVSIVWIIGKNSQISFWCLLFLMSCSTNTIKQSFASMVYSNTITKGSFVVNNNDSLLVKDIVHPKNLTGYFDSLLRCKDMTIPYHCDSVDGIRMVMKGINLLHKYQDGKVKYYPTDSILNALESMRLELGYVYSHRGEDLTETDYGFFVRFLEQAVRLSPNLYQLTNVISADRKVGVINFREWSYNPLFSFIAVMDKPNVRKIKMLDSGVNLDKIFKLEKNGRTYYLLSNNFSILSFSQWIYDEARNEVYEVYNKENALHEWRMECPQDYVLVFNPANVCWNLCYKKGEVYIPIKGTKTLYLELNPTHSYFHVK